MIRTAAPFSLVLALIPCVSACDRTGNPDIPDTIAGRCIYTNSFSAAEECREFRGDGWTDDAASSNCKEWEATFEAGAACEYTSVLGACILTETSDRVVRVVIPGSDPGKCGSSERGCELFGGGIFVPAEVCGGAAADVEETGPFFTPAALECRDPLPGEPAGAGDDGKVCTWSMISGCTEPGRHFADYGSCEAVRTQRPYHPAPPAPPPEKPDTRLQDPSYVAELGWVKEQVEASACVCCHQDSITPKGASVWDIDAKDNWISTFSTYGLAFAGGFLDSSLLGAYPPHENNGFDRSKTGIPTTDPERMRKFFENELAHRGSTPDAWAKFDPVPQPFYAMDQYEPTACAEGEKIAPDYTMTWTGGGARYVYVLEPGTRNPGVPPNLDLPTGTIWRLDVPPDGKSVRSGQLRYGELPAGTSQAFPLDGAPAPLETGKTYYLYVLADIAQPITRCTFEYGK
ncbi:MAG: hypothetical protein IPM54_42155 [Polyangiaceae bacterium]|nr:hypothetical protein [Polyangiaceae bacterium]